MNPNFKLPADVQYYMYSTSESITVFFFPPSLVPCLHGAARLKKAVGCLFYAEACFLKVPECWLGNGEAGREQEKEPRREEKDF